MGQKRRVFNKLRHKNNKGKLDIGLSMADDNTEEIRQLFLDNTKNFLEFADDDNDNIIHIALMHEHDELIPLFLKHEPELIHHTNYSGQSPLRFAITEGLTPNTVKLLLSNGSNPKEFMIGGRTLLHLAAEKGYSNLIPLLLAEKLDIDCRDSNSETPLLLALNNGHDKTASILLKNGADPLLRHETFGSPLHIALKWNCMDSIDLLLNDNEVVTNMNEFRMTHDKATPIMTAVTYCDFPVVERMISLGANINAHNISSISVLSYSLGNGNSAARDEIALYLLDKGIDLYPDRETMLNQAINVNADIAIIEQLIEYGMDVNKKDHTQKSPLYIAIEQENIEAVNSLLAAGADPAMPSFNERRPIDLLYEIENKQLAVDILEQLQKYGFDINSYGRAHRTPLQEAAFTGHVEIAEYLLKQDIDIEIQSQDYWKKTAFMFTADGFKNIEEKSIIADMLHKKNANLEATDTLGNTVMHQLSENVNIERLKKFHSMDTLLSTRNNSGATPLMTAIKHGRTENVLYIAQAISHDINEKDSKGSTLIHHIAKLGKQHVLAGVLENSFSEDIDWNIRDNEGRTPLMLAAYEGHSTLMEMLIENGAKINLLDKNGRSAIYYATVKFSPKPVEILLNNNANLHIFPKNDTRGFLHHAAETGLPTITGYFLKAGLNIDKKDKDGNTALHIAVRFNNAELVDYLLSNGANPNVKNNADFYPHDIAYHKNYSSIMSTIKRHIDEREQNKSNTLTPKIQSKPNNPYF